MILKVTEKTGLHPFSRTFLEKPQWRDQIQIDPPSPALKLKRFALAEIVSNLIVRL